MISETVHAASEEAVAKKLKQLCPLPLQLAWHENRSSFLICRKAQGFIHLRLHRLFVGAPTPVLEAVCRYIVRGDRKAGSIVRQMAHLYFSQNSLLPELLHSTGNIYDLKAIALRIKTQYFQGVSQAEVAIGWSRPFRCRKFRCITFGSYDRHRNQIRIHPLLDDPDVPLYFLEFIIYHEMLHAVCPSFIDARGVIRCHTPEFRTLEKKFVDFAAAKQWEKTSLQFFKTKLNKVCNGRT